MAVSVCMSPARLMPHPHTLKLAGTAAQIIPIKYLTADFRTYG
jgi:hypothetical protein